MKILALDSSGLVASVALMENDTLTAEYNIQYKKTHSQTLLPMMDEMKKMVDLDLATLDAVALAAGPGSFTGLRIGSATAKGLGQALDIPLIEVPTLEGLAYNMYGFGGLICPMMDARRGQVYTGVYEFVREGKTAEIREEGERTEGQSVAEGLDVREGLQAAGICGEGIWQGGYAMRTVKGQCAVAIEEMTGFLNDLGQEVIFLGDGVPVFKEKLRELMKVGYSFAPAHMNRQRAASVAALGGVYYRLGKTVPAAEHVPIYLRLSQAERERKEKGGC